MLTRRDLLRSAALLSATACPLSLAAATEVRLPF
jgi:hypothetical protein